MRRRSKLFGSFLATVLCFALVTGCATATDYPLALSTKLQASVQLVTQLSSDGKYQAALTALQTLRGDLADARKDGSVSGERVKEIKAAIATVEKELKAKIRAGKKADEKHTSAPEETTTAPEPVPEPVPEAPVIPAPAPEEPVQPPAPEDTGASTPTQTPELTPTQEPEPTQTPEPAPTPTQTPEPTEPPPSSTIPEIPTPDLPSGSPDRAVPPPSDEPPDEGGNTSPGTASP